jgi:hypothetical protein
MNRRLLIGLLGASLGNRAQRRRNSLIGVWKLQSCRRNFTDGHAELPFGEKPVGRIQYDRSGRMSAMLMRPGRRSILPPGIQLDHATDEELRDAVSGFVAYFGTFDVDLPNQTVIHHVQASLAPAWVGADLKRNFRFERGSLVLTRQATGVVDTLIWVRESD